MAKEEKSNNNHDSARRATKQRQQAIRRAAAASRKATSGAQPIGLRDLQMEKKAEARAAKEEARMRRMETEERRRMAKEVIDSIPTKKMVILMPKNGTDEAFDQWAQLCQDVKQGIRYRGLTDIAWNDDWYSKGRMNLAVVQKK